MTTDDRLRIRLVALALAAMLAAAAGIPGPATPDRQVTGDEPHYLVTALSVADDGDLDVADEYAAGQVSYLARRPQGAGGTDGRIIEPHDPLLPVLLAFPVRVGGWWAAKMALAAVAGALAAAMAWVMVRRFDVTSATAFVVTGVFAASAPLAVYGHQVYPELPAALATTLGIAAVTAPANIRRLVLVAAVIVALPWLSVKYVPVAAALACAALWRAWHRHRRDALALASALAAAGLAYVALHVTWYGGATVYASGAFFAEHGGQSSVLGTSPNYLGRATRLVGLLTDHGFGLAAWQPAWLLCVPAVAALTRRRPRGWVALVGVAGVGWLGASFLAATMHGWWFPGRQVVVVLPAVVITIAWWVDGSTGRLGALLLLGSTGVVTYGLLAWEVAQGGLTWVVDFAAFDAPWSRAWRWLLPDYRLPRLSTWARHGTFVALFAGAAWAAYRSAGTRTDPLRGGRIRRRLVDAGSSP